MLQHSDFDIVQYRATAIPIITKSLAVCIKDFSQEDQSRILHWLTNMLESNMWQRCAQKKGGSYVFNQNALWKIVDSSLKNDENISLEMHSLLNSYHLTNLGEIATFLLVSVSPILTWAARDMRKSFAWPAEVFGTKINNRIVSDWVRSVMEELIPLLPPIGPDTIRELIASPDGFELLSDLAEFSLVFSAGKYVVEWPYRKAFLGIFDEYMASNPIDVEYSPLVDAFNEALRNTHREYTQGTILPIESSCSENLKAYLQDLALIYERVRPLLFPDLDNLRFLIHFTCDSTCDYKYIYYADKLSLLFSIEWEYQYNLPNLKLFKIIPDKKNDAPNCTGAKSSANSVDVFDRMVKYVLRRNRAEEVSIIVAMMQNIYRKDDEKMEIIDNIETQWQEKHAPKVHTDYNFNQPVGQVVAHADIVNGKEN